MYGFDTGFDMPKIVPFILAGGTGTRLWPASRSACPKQFIRLFDQPPLFQQTITRLRAVEGAAPPVVLGSAEHRFLIAEQLRELDVKPGAIVLEPEPRNTAPAVLTAALMAAAEDPDALVLILPADHYMPEPERFAEALRLAAKAAQEGKIITFGITSTRPETGYGYIHTSPIATRGEPLQVIEFVEKPDLKTARAYLKKGGYYWNAGIFLAAARTWAEAFDKHAADLRGPCYEALKLTRRDLDFLRLEPAAWSEARSISVDYAVMEKASNVVCVPYAGEWSDLGSWSALLELRQRHDGADGQGNVTHGDVLMEDVSGSLAYSEDGTCLALVGLSDVVAVATRDAVLVAPKERAQHVREIVKKLSARGREEAVFHKRVYRPWGWFEQLAMGERYQVKSLMVKPGARLSLQSHYHRAEHWIVVSGTVRVTRGDKTFLLSENESTYIPIGEKHRLENPGRIPALLIEVQSGSYLGEDDIVRHADDFAREPGE